MKTVFAKYEHTAIGFPGVVLKFTEEHGNPIEDAIVVTNGVIVCAWNWQYHVQSARELQQPGNKELERFDNWVRNRYKDDLSVQG